MISVYLRTNKFTCFKDSAEMQGPEMYDGEKYSCIIVENISAGLAVPGQGRGGVHLVTLLRGGETTPAGSSRRSHPPELEQ